jgi:type I restriction enzyme S subunit
MSEVVERGNREKQGNGELPEGWIEAPFEKIGKLLSGVSYEKEVARSSAKEGYIPILRATNIQNDQLLLDSDLVYVPEDYVNKKQELKPGDVVICMSSGSKHLVGKTGQLRKEWYGSFGAFCAVARFEKNVERSFYGYFFNSPKYHSLVRERSSGVNINNLRRGDIETIILPLPTKLEQKRISAAIETQFTRLDAAVNSLERAQIKLERYRASVLQSACEGRLVPTEAALARHVVGEDRDRPYEPAEQLLERILVERRRKWEEERWAYEIERAKKKAAQAERKAAGLPYYIRELEPEHWQDRTPEEYEPYLPKSDKWKEKYDEPEPPDTEDLPELPEGWCWASLAELSWQSDYGTSQKCRYDADGPPVLRIPNILDNKFDLSDLKMATQPDELKEADLLEPGDLLIIRTNGSRNLIGRSALVRNDFRNEHYFASYLIRYRIIFVSEWISAIWNANMMRQQLESRAATTAGQYNLSLSRLDPLPIPLPPLAEQHRIVTEVERRLSIIDALEQAVATNLTRAERMRQAILKKAFEGRLVEQRPEEEPASALLE